MRSVGEKKIQTEAQGKKTIVLDKRHLWDKQSHECTTGVSDGKERENRAEAIVEERMQEHENINLYVQEAWKTVSGMNTKKLIFSHMISRLLKPKTKRKHQLE